ncbi:MAG TPA: GPW/gp25 family protein [Longimicrobium sp.]|nr:GPW/gp25 family protein [Longimicrobium sp.]
MKTADRLGRGWRYPVLPREGDLAYEQGAEKVRQAIWIVLDTEPGERVMRPDFGCGLRRYLARPNSSATRALMAQDVSRALARWEPRVDVKRVSVDEGDDPALVLVQVSYTHVRDGRPGNLVYPFYLE